MTDYPTPSRYYVEYLDGTFAVCTADDADDALEQLCRDIEMAHGPKAGEPPTGATVDDCG